ncbi:MAG: cyclic nucleotide-binding domain-containing protein [Ardenticatenaceae bacterium]|nr:cyclic nucleotide-binding domain-containing protein [Anaerolineales bacterium]MCB8980844.1 cyclic nucleotide-binding domain-containing protein [Ardenticatenaceae bacterium]
MATKAEFLEQHPLFKELTEEEIEALAQITDEVRYENGAMVAYQGDVADSLYIVKSGRLYAEARKNDIENDSYVVSSKNYLTGDYFGEDWLFVPNVHPANVKADSRQGNPAILLIITGTNFVRFLNQYPQALPNLAPEVEMVDEEERVVGGLTDEAFAEAQKLFAKAKRRRSVISILPDELVQYSARRSRWYLLVQIFLPLFLMIVIPGGLLYFFGTQPSDAFLYRLRFWVPGILFIVLFGVLLFQVLDWSNDYFVVTNKRVVHREFDLRTFRVDIKTARIDQVQSVEILKPTFVSNLLNFGTARITTASAFGTIFFDNIDNPIRVKDTLDRQSKMVKTLDASREQTLLRQTFGEHFAVRPQYEPVGEKAAPLPPIRPAYEDSFWYRLRQRYYWRVETENAIIYRKHFIVLIIESAIPIGLALLGLLLTFVLIYYFQFTFRQLLPFLIFGYAIDIFWLVWRVEDWRNDMFQLTDRLIVDIDRRPFGFGESRKQALLSNIQNVNAYTPGLVHTIFNYGNVEIETAGAESNLVFENIPYPSVIQSDIFAQLENMLEQQNRRQRGTRHKEYALLLDVYKQTMEQDRIPDRTPGDVPPL